MKNLNKKFITKPALTTFFVLFTSALLLVSCSSMMEVTDAAAQIAGETGAISKEVADSISTSAKAVASAAEVITPEQEYYIGRAVAGTILENYKVYNNQAMQKYLNEICYTLVINSDKPELYNGYHVAILDSDEINAFASSGGHILVTRGLLKCTNSEDALAAVLAHEISHIHLQHGIKAIKSNRVTNALMATAGTAIVVANDGSKEALELVGAFDDSVKEIVTKMVDSGYSQNQEFDADKNALKIMASAGYNPNAMKEMLLLIKASSTSTNKGFGKTHPSADDRMKKLESEYAKYSVPNTMDARKNRFKTVKF